MRHWLIILCFWSLAVSAQEKGRVYGTVLDKNTKEPLIGALVKVINSEDGAVTDENGKYQLETRLGTFAFTASYIGYDTLVKYNVVVTSGNLQNVDFDLEVSQTELAEVLVAGAKINSARAATNLSPLSVQTMTVEEIRSNPGGNFDISKVIQALPGVAGSTGFGGFRNDLILRGGAPNENVYFLDGIEIPVLNHFSTQGSAGGPTGIINTAFTKEVRLSTSAFPAQTDNALSGVFEIFQREGNPQKLQSNIRLSASEVAISADGPINQNTTFLASVRRSYLQLLFELIDLPIRPNYWDFQTKITTQWSKRTKINFIGIGAIDDFSFAIPKNADAENTYIVRSTPIIKQWNYTGGVSINHLIDNGYLLLALSRNQFNNNVTRYENNENPIPGTEAFSSLSNETENKLRFLMHKNYRKTDLDLGFTIQNVLFDNDFDALIRKGFINPDGSILQPEVRYVFNSAINFFKYGFFVQGSRKFNNDILVSGGLRSDMNSFTNKGNDLLRTLSPRLNISIPAGDEFKFNASSGIYYKIPVLTILGFRDNDSALVNQNADYTRSRHIAAGLEYSPQPSLRMTVEGFYKNYSNYPVSSFTGISLANTGGDFNAVGNERVVTNGVGRVYGVEFFIQKKLTNKIFYTVSYTWFDSQFSGSDGNLIRAAWDNQHLISVIAGLKLKRSWELGIKYRNAGGSPYTPFDMEASRLNYLSIGQGVVDNARLNQLELSPFNQLDLRIDKKWNFSQWTLDLFLDIQNVLSTQSEAFPNYTFERNEDNTDFKTTDGQPLTLDGSNAFPLILDNVSGRLVPTLGFIIEW